MLSLDVVVGSLIQIDKIPLFSTKSEISLFADELDALKALDAISVK
jgi:hypothetical protein